MSIPNTASLLQGAQLALSQGDSRKAADLSRKALRHEPKNADAVYFLGLAHALSGELEPAIERWRQVVQLNPRQFAALANLGTALWQRGEYPEAITHLRAAIAIDGSHAQMHDNLAQAYYAYGVEQHRAGQLAAAVGSYEQALTVTPKFAQAWRDRGRALETLQKLSDALVSYQHAVELDPDDAGSVAGMLSCSVRSCEWELAGHSLERLRQLPQGLAAIHPFLALSVFDDPAELKVIAAARSAGGTLTAAVPRRPDGRIRIAYVSSDLRDHPVAHLVVGLLERHDRQQFEVHAIALNPGADERLRRSVEHWHDVGAQSDLEIAQRMRALQIDIAIDLNGHTVGARPGIFANRAAPIQVGYLGYAGTSGAPYMDYLVADDVVIPHGAEGWYTEKVVRLPRCVLPNDDQRPIAAAPSRESAGLPAHGFVFCAFTNGYKINPPVFDVWMRLLREIPGSVLWLRAAATAESNLVREAAARGIDASRLVFAPHVASMAEHLGRHRLADLYLDTSPYNAHSTACDALWAGVPVLTCTGRTMAARVATSVLTTAGLPELIAKDLAEYESRALQLAREPERLARLRQRLAEQRSPLFDTAVYCRNLEQAYAQMAARAP